MPNTSTPPLPDQWFQVYTHRGNGEWFVATAGPKLELIKAQAAGVLQKNGVAVIVRVKYKPLRRSLRGVSKSRSTGITPRHRSPRKSTGKPVAELISA